MANCVNFDSLHDFLTLYIKHINNLHVKNDNNIPS